MLPGMDSKSIVLFCVAVFMVMCYGVGMLVLGWLCGNFVELLWFIEGMLVVCMLGDLYILFKRHE